MTTDTKKYEMELDELELVSGGTNEEYEQIIAEIRSNPDLFVFYKRIQQQKHGTSEIYPIVRAVVSKVIGGQSVCLDCGGGSNFYGMGAFKMSHEEVIRALRSFRL